MDEQNNKHEDDCFLCKHPLFKLLLISILVFLGAYAAFYVVSDWHFKRMMNPEFHMHKIEKRLIQDERMAERAMKKDFKQDFREMSHGVKFVYVVRTPDSYKILVNLVPFDNNEKNVEVKTNDNHLTISAAGEKVSKNKNEIVEFSQSLTFPEDVDLEKITKIREGNFYVISVPIE